MIMVHEQDSERTLKELAEMNFVSSQGNPKIEFRLSEITKYILPGKVLDVGCRDGYLQKFLGPEHEYYGLDIVDDGSGNIRNLSLVDVTKEKLPFGDGYFDTIVAGEFLEHISNFFYTVGEFSRVLRPGGRLIITVPNIARFYHTVCVIRKKNYLRQYTRETLKKPDEHIHGFDEKLLASLLLHHGIESIYCDRLYNFYGTRKLPEMRLFKVFALYVLVVGEKRQESGKKEGEEKEVKCEEEKEGKCEVEEKEGKWEEGEEEGKCDEEEENGVKCEEEEEEEKEGKCEVEEQLEIGTSKEDRHGE